MRLLPVLLVVLILVGCGDGSGDLAGDAALADATWIEVELATGAVAAISTPTAHDLAAARWRSSHAIFRRIPAGTCTGKAALLPGGGEPEDAVSLSSDGSRWLAVFELTTAQWAHLTAADDGNGDSRPLTGVPVSEVAAVIAATTLHRLRLELPEAGLWAVACNAGQDTLYAWGDGTVAAVTDAYAVHFPTAGAAPATVGSRLPNAWGLYDLHGNVWEMVRRAEGDFEARGGAFDSPTLQCRTANAVALDADLAAPSVGVRLALRR